MLHTHEVTGSSPVVSTKKKSTPIGVLQTVEKVQLLLGFFHFL